MIPIGEKISVRYLSAPSMDFQLNSQPQLGAERRDEKTRALGELFHLVARTQSENGGSQSAVFAADLPRSYGSETLCLMACDPHSLFVYWDIDWEAVFSEQPPRAKKVHLRILDPEGVEQTVVEVEPMAGSCHVSVSAADNLYRGEIGYFQPPGFWNCVATSEVVVTPPDSFALPSEADFATVPFHLSFQRMIEALRASKQENETLTAMLRDLRERAASPEATGELTVEQRELARVLDTAHFVIPDADLQPGEPVGIWTQRRFARVLGFGPSSPDGGFGGSSRSA